ncbi:unnamed protein product, partial [Effrenium voratum]
APPPRAPPLAPPAPSAPPLAPVPPVPPLPPASGAQPEEAEQVLTRLRGAVKRHGVAPIHLFQCLDVSRQGSLGPKEFSRLAWALEPNLDFQDLARLFHLLGAEKSRLSAVCFCRALGEEPEALSPCSKASKAAVPKVLRIAGPSWQQLGRDFAWAKVAEAGSDEALRAFVQRWRPKKAPKAAIAPPPKSAAGEKPAVGPKEPKELRASEARSRASSYSSEDFEGSNQSYSESFASETVTLRK